MQVKPKKSLFALTGAINFTNEIIQIIDTNFNISISVRIATYRY